MTWERGRNLILSEEPQAAAWRSKHFLLTHHSGVADTTDVMVYWVEEYTKVTEH
jgi:hypothetical protein